MPDFRISVSPNNVSIKLDEFVEETDVLKHLSFNETMIEELLQTHAGHQAYWEALAIKLKKKSEAFEAEIVKKWWAHNRIYAKLILKAQGEKSPTVNAINDMTVLVYSEDAKEKIISYVDLAWEAYKKGKNIEVSKDQFKKDMMLWISLDPIWYFEYVVRTQNKLEEDSKLVQVFADRLNSRSFHMKEYLDLIKAKKYNIEPKSERELMDRLSGKG